MGGVREQVKLLEQQVESYKEACSTEEREMAEVLAAEKKARSQVRSDMSCPVIPLSCDMSCPVILLSCDCDTLSFEMC